MQPKDLRLATERDLENSIGAATAPLDQRLEDLEVSAGFTPGDINDTTTASLIRNQESDTHSELSAEIESRIAQTAGGLVGSDLVHRIVAVPVGSALPVLQDGDMVVRYVPADAKQYHIVFGEYELESGPVFAGVTNLMSGTTGIIKAIEGGTNGRVLRLQGDTPICYAVTEAATDPLGADSEILCRWRSANTSLADGLTVFLRVQDEQNFYYTRRRQAGTSSLMIRYAGSQSTILATPIATLDPWTWYYTRARIQGETFSMKTWKESETEPTNWDSSIATLTFSSGFAGVGKNGPGAIFEIDWFTHATGGLTAVAP